MASWGEGLKEIGQPCLYWGGGAIRSEVARRRGCGPIIVVLADQGVGLLGVGGWEEAFGWPLCS